MRFPLFAGLFFAVVCARAGSDTSLVLKKVIRGNLASKSVVHSGNGLFFAQNMMYKHTISVFNRAYTLVKTIPDQVKLADFGVEQAKGLYRGAPVEAAFTHNGKYAWISNYHMTGEGYTKPGCDTCSGSGYDNSYLYRLNTETFSIEKVIRVGSVPKYVAACPNNKYVLVSNWSSGDVSVVDVTTSTEIKRIKAGRYPRGIVVDSKSKYAYVAMMGGTGILKIDLDDFSTGWIKQVGLSPRHLCITSNDSLLYVSLNAEGKIARVNLHNNQVSKINCSGAPRSMVLSGDDRFLYVVNYTAGKMSKINLAEFRLVEQCDTHKEPIGITFDNVLNEVWVACYSGSIMVFEDHDYRKPDVDLGWVMEGMTGLYNGISNLVSDLVPQEEQPADDEEVNVVREKNAARQTPAPAAGKTPGPVALPSGKPNPVPGKNAAETVPAAGEFYVVVGSFKVEANAQRLCEKFRAKGYPAVTFRNKNGLLCTALGAYADAAAARATLGKIKTEEQTDGWVTGF